MGRDKEAGRRSWHVQLFGDIRVSFRGEATPPFTNRKVAQLLIFLAVRQGQSVSRDAVCEALWPGEYIEIGRDRLRQTLALLNRHFREAGNESPIEATKTTISLGSSCEVDYRMALASPLDVSLDGIFAEGFVDDWLVDLRYSITNELAMAFRSAAEHADDPNASLLAAEKGLCLSPLDEGLNTTYIQALCDLDRRSEALLHARKFEERLQQSLGLQPSSTWQTFVDGIRPTADGMEIAKWSNVPVPLDGFFGREVELSHLNDHFKEKKSRLLTITGTGGAGKTRLISEFIRQLDTSTLSRVWVLGLAEHDSIAQVATEIARMGDTILPHGKEFGSALAPIFARGNSLLVLDNCEHLMPEIAALAKSLLHHSANLTILATSRIRLGVHGEREVPLEPLAVPELDQPDPWQSPAFQLLVDRVRAYDHRYDPKTSDIAEAIKLCRILEGVPLAVEIAASQSSILSVAQLRQQLEGTVVELANDRRDAPERHLALRNTLQWGIERLSVDERLALAQLSLMPGSWTLEDASAVLKRDDTVAILESLRSHSLIALASGSRIRRFRMLEMVRQFAKPLLSQEQAEETVARHYEHFRGKLDELYDRRYEPEQTPIIEAFRSDLAHYRLAIQTGLRLQSAKATCPIFLRKSELFAQSIGALEEWAGYFTAALEVGGFSHRDQGSIWAYCAHGMAFMGNFETADTVIENIRKFLADSTEHHFRRFLINQTASLVASGGLEKYYAELIQLLREVTDGELLEDQDIISLHSLARILMQDGRQDEARDILLRAEETGKIIARDRSVLWVSYQIALIDQRRGEYRQTIDRTKFSLERLARSGDQVLVIMFASIVVGSVVPLDPNGRHRILCYRLLQFVRRYRQQYSLGSDEGETAMLDEAEAMILQSRDRPPDSDDLTPQLAVEVLHQLLEQFA